MFHDLERAVSRPLSLIFFFAAYLMSDGLEKKQIMHKISICKILSPIVEKCLVFFSFLICFSWF